METHGHDSTGAWLCHVCARPPGMYVWPEEGGVASLSALDYRKRRGLGERDEQMAILVMRVSGSHFGNYFMPCAAGVRTSSAPRSASILRRSIDMDSGMTRMSR